MSKRDFVLPVFCTTIGLLSACTSSKVDDTLAVTTPSSQTTGSIRRPIASVNRLSDIGTPSLVESQPRSTGEKVIVEQVAMVRPLPAPQGQNQSSRNSSKRIYPPRFRDAKPINFGRVQPAHYSIHGVDVSHHQGKIDWPKLRRQGANFAYIKATEGDDFKDPRFRENWDAAAKAGVARGAYHFFYWCSYASDQASWFIRNVPKSKGALPPVIDVEWNNHSRTCPDRPSKTVVLKKMKVFMDRLERHYGQRPIIYTAPDFYADNLQGKFKNYSFWLRSVANHPKQRYPGREFAFWQYSGTGLSSNHPTQIDLNVFNGNKASWQRWLKQRTY